MDRASQKDLLEQGTELRALGDIEGARQAFDAAVKLAPEEAEPHHHLAAALDALGHPDRAEVEYQVALALAPGSGSTARALAILLLSQGCYTEGFKLFERRHELPGLAKPALPFPEWRGEPIAGRKLLIWPEQGLGDQIQFARFAPILQRLDADVTLVCWPPLARLFELSLGVRVIAAGGTIEFPDPDYWVMTMSLAARLALPPEDLPNWPYLTAPALRTPLPEGARIGLMTAGNRHNANDTNRSLSADQAERLKAIPGAISLDPADTGATDFADTAAIIADLDLVISVDTAAAHLAGAMGKRCWTLLPRVGGDWRWFRDRTDSPWYPSMRLFRQRAAGDWASVVDEVLLTLGEDVR